MKLSSREVQNAILHNDTARVAEMLEGFDFTKDKTPTHFTPADKGLVSTMLSFASAMSYHDDLNSDLAKELIERTAMTVDIFSFLRLVVVAAEIETYDFDVIPEGIRTPLRNNSDYTDEIAYAIEKLDDDAFAALLAFLPTGEVEQLHTKFNLPIMRRIHAEETIPEDLMLAYMGLCPRETIDEHFGDIPDALSVLGSLALLSKLFGGMYVSGDKDEDGKGHECHCGGRHGERDGRHPDE